VIYCRGNKTRENINSNNISKISSLLPIPSKKKYERARQSERLSGDVRECKETPISIDSHMNEGGSGHDNENEKCP
jgi:hypothetical protein